MERVLIPMTFYNLNTKSIEEYYVNIVADVNYIQRFNLQHIKEIPELAFEIFADVYDKDKNKIVDDIIFLSYGDETNILDALLTIDDIERLKYKPIVNNKKRSDKIHPGQ